MRFFLKNLTTFSSNHHFMVRNLFNSRTCSLSCLTWLEIQINIHFHLLNCFQTHILCNIADRSLLMWKFLSFYLFVSLLISHRVFFITLAKTLLFEIRKFLCLFATATVLFHFIVFLRVFDSCLDNVWAQYVAYTRLEGEIIYTWTSFFFCQIVCGISFFHFTNLLDGLLFRYPINMSSNKVFPLKFFLVGLGQFIIFSLVSKWW